MRKGTWLKSVVKMDLQKELDTRSVYTQKKVIVLIKKGDPDRGRDTEMETSVLLKDRTDLRKGIISKVYTGRDTTKNVRIGTRSNKTRQNNKNCQEILECKQNTTWDVRTLKLGDKNIDGIQITDNPEGSTSDSEMKTRHCTVLQRKTYLIQIL